MPKCGRAICCMSRGNGWRRQPMPTSLQRRVGALESKHAVPDRSAETAAAAETFRAKMDALIDRMEGRTADPATMSLAEQIACEYWTDPEGALTRMQEAAQ